MQQYTRAWKLLLEYDEGRLAETPVHPVKPAAGLSLEDARTVIARLRESLAERGEATDLFGAERSDQLHGILGASIRLSAASRYPTVQARAAHLLYFVIKDHPFADGNKRIGTLLFWNTSGATACSPDRTAGRVLPITRWSHWRCSWRKANRRKRI